MKRVLGVIVEYNPFHNGHLHHIQRSKEITNSNYVIGVMSGNYVQRGEPAIVNKWARTEIALQNGVDLVIELPTVYATQSAEGFSIGAIHLLANTGVVTDLVFGSEIGEIGLLYKVANRLLELEKNNNLIKDKLKEGVSYADALRKLVDDNSVLKGSNNILAVEYIKQIIMLHNPFNVHTVKRINNDYNDLDLPKDESFIASATALRPQIKSNSENYKTFVPTNSYKVLQRTFLHQQWAADLDIMSPFFFNLLIREGHLGLNKLARVEKGLENRILNKSFNAKSINELVESVKSKRFPKSRISRLFLHFMLKIENELIIESNAQAGQYLRVLGCTNNGLELLKSMKSNCDLPLSLNYNRLLKSFTSNSIGSKQLELENLATNLYSSFFYKEKSRQLEYTNNAIILNN